VQGLSGETANEPVSAVTTLGMSGSAGDLAHFRFRRHSGPCPDLPLATSAKSTPRGVGLAATLKKGGTPLFHRLAAPVGSPQVVRSCFNVRCGMNGSVTPRSSYGNHLNRDDKYMKWGQHEATDR
jgi:hypothetical protein